MGAAWTPRQRATVVWGALLLLVAMEVLERTLFVLFELNFSVDGPGPWALAVLGLLSGLLYLVGMQRIWPHHRPLLGGLTAASPVLVALHLAPDPRLALIGGLLWHLAATPLLFALLASLRRRATMAVALALALRIGMRAWTDGAPLAATTMGTYLLLAITVVGAATWFQVQKEVAAGTRRLPSPAPLWAFMAASVAWVGTPSAVWMWTGHDPVQIQVAALVGTAAGAWSTLRGSWAGLARAWQGALVLAVAAAWTLWGPWPPLGVAAAAWAILVALDSALDRPRHAQMVRHAATTVLVQVVVVALVFLHIVAVNWAFVPGAALLAGHADVVLWAIVAVVGVAVLRRHDWGVAT